MSDTKELKESLPFSLYDFFGYLFPGTYAAGFLIYIFSIAEKEKFDKLCDLYFKEFRTDMPFIEGLFIFLILIVGLYILGHLIAMISHIIIDRVIVQGILNYPFNRFMIDNDDTMMTRQLTYKVLFILCLICYMFVPLIVIPLFAFKYGNWYLLIGIPVSYLSTFLATRKKYILMAAPLIPMIINWIFFNGFHFDDYATFFYCCALWGGFFYLLAVEYEVDFAKTEIMRNPALFNELSEDGRIYFLRKNKETEGT